MTALAFNRIGLPALAAFVFLLVIVLPTVRLRRRHATWPVSTRAARTPLEWYVGAVLALSIVGYGVFFAGYALGELRRLSIRPPTGTLNWIGWTTALASVMFMAICQA